jgi:hypothetical protein
MRWLVKNAKLFVLIQTADGARVYDADSDFLYYANPNTHLHPDMPTGYAFLAQTVEDVHEGARIQRLLITDLLSPPEPDPWRRGEMMRSVSHLFPQSCHVQWSGDRAALQGFICKGMPHEVECIVALREQGRLYRDPVVNGIRALQALEI